MRACGSTGRAARLIGTDQGARFRGACFPPLPSSLAAVRALSAPSPLDILAMVDKMGAR